MRRGRLPVLSRTVRSALFARARTVMAARSLSSSRPTAMSARPSSAGVLPCAGAAGANPHRPGAAP